MTRSSQGSLRRAVRRFLLGSGPLKRATDRVQMAARFVLVLSVVAAPILGAVAAGATRSHLDAVAATQAAERHSAHAVLLEPAVPPRADSDWQRPVTSVSARVGWTVAGHDRSGAAAVPVGTSIGTAVPVWLDDRGRLTEPPLSSGSIGGLAVLAYEGTGFGVPLVTGLLYGLLSAALDAHRRRRWAQGWVRLDRESSAPH